MSVKNKQKRTRIKTTVQVSPVLPLREVRRSSFFKAHWRQLCLIGLLALGLYFQSISFGYVLDDIVVIENNQFTQQGVNGIPSIFKYESFQGYFGEQAEVVEGGRYRPLSIATFALERSLFGTNKGVSHFLNALLYALTGIILYRVLLLMFPAAAEGKRWWYFTVPFVATLLFIAHPLHVEVVANIKGRDEILALLGEAGGLYYTFRYLDARKSKYLLYSFLCFFLGILSKEGVITFLAIVPITAYFFTRSNLSERLKATLPVVAASVIYLIMRVNAIGHLMGGAEITDVMNNPFYGMSFGEKTATIFYTLLLYLKLLVFPHPLTHDYYPYQVPVMQWSDWQALLSLALYTGLAVVAIKGWKRKTIPSYAILFYLVTLSIVSNLFISIGTFMNERFLYHASLGFCIVVAWLLVEKLPVNLVWRRAALGVFVLSTLALSAKTMDRLPDWKSTATLDQSAIKVSTNSARANYCYGLELWYTKYLRLPKKAPVSIRKSALDSVKYYFDKSVQIVPAYSLANSMKAGVAAEYHKMDHNYQNLLRVFEEVNYTGLYEKFIPEYLRYVNGSTVNRKDATMLEQFYNKMIDYYKLNNPGSNRLIEYQTLLKDLQGRLGTMQ